MGELAFRILESTDPNAWLIVVTDQPLPASSLLHAEIEQLRDPSEQPSLVITAGDISAFFNAVHAQPSGILIVVGAEKFSADQWRTLDAYRSRLMRNGTAALLLDEVSAARVENTAPNFASWVGGRIWRLADAVAVPSLSPSEIEQRLSALRAWAGRGDAEILRLAETGALPRDPEYAEWLMLLGRSELLVS